MKRLLPLLLLPLLVAAAGAFEAGEQMQFADGMYVRGLYDMAVEEYLKLLREAPDFKETDTILFRAAECYRQLGMKKSADEFYARLMEGFPESEHRFKAQLRRAELFVAARRFTEAAQQLRLLLERDPPPDLAASALYYLGYSEKRAGALEGAEKVLRKVVDQYPDSPFSSFAALEMAELLGERGDASGEARAWYRKALEKPATPRVAAEALFQLGEQAYREKDYTGSAEAYGRLLDEYPDDRRAGEARLQGAWSFHNLGRCEEALRIVGQALARAPEESVVDWLYLKANCERQLGRDQQALRTYEELQSHAPTGAVARAASYERALMAFREKDFAGVVEQARELEPMGETAEDLNWVLAESYAALGQREQALAFYARVAEGVGAGERSPVAAYRLAALQQEEGAYEEAGKNFRRFTDRYPKHELAPDALFAAAFCRAKRNDTPGALSDWTRLVSQYPDYKRAEEALYQKGIAEIRLERKEQAEQSLRLLLKRFPRSGLAGEAHRWLGVLLEEQGDMTGAEQALRAALAAGLEEVVGNRVRLRLATILQKQDKFEEAAGFLDALLTTDVAATLQPPLLEWLARYHLDASSFDRAVAAADVLLQVAGLESWKQIGWYLKGKALEGAGRAQDARQAFREALTCKATTRDGAEAALQLGRMALDEGNFADAATYYEKTSDLSSSAELLDLRAQSYYGLARTAEAEKRWEEAARYFMGVAILFDDANLTPECLSRAAEAFGRLDRGDDRQKALLELKKRYPDSEWAKKVEQPGT